MEFCPWISRHFTLLALWRPNILNFDNWAKIAGLVTSQAWKKTLDTHFSGWELMRTPENYNSLRLFVSLQLDILA